VGLLHLGSDIVSKATRSMLKPKPTAIGSLRLSYRHIGADLTIRRCGTG
jgi:hypothetical protein